MSESPADTLRFRDLFFGSLGTSYPDEILRQLFASGRQHLMAYLPPPDLGVTPLVSAAPDIMAALDSAYRERTPLDFYRHAVATPASPMEPARIDAALKRTPLTVVIFPGVFSEFIETKPFQELFSLPHSTARDDWTTALANFAGRHPGEAEETLHDDQFALDRLDPEQPMSAFVRRPLEELVAVSSLDDAAGSPLLRAVLLLPRRLSLETLDDFSSIATVLLRRLGKVFTVLGVPEHIVFLGYSMGAPVGLEVLARAHAAGESWVEHVRGFIGVGGVIFGSHAADDALRPVPDRRDNLAHRQLTALRSLAGALRVPHGPLLGSNGRLAALRTNAKAWLDFGAEWAATLESLTKAGPKITIPMLIRLVRKVDLRPAVGLLGTVITETFRFKSPVWNAASVARLKRLVEAALAAVDGLSTEARVRWWSMSTLPTHGLRYYAVAGSMSDSEDGPEAPRLWDNDTTYNPGSLDDEFLRHGYRELVAASGQRLNDSQVAVVRAQFWPALAAQLNAAYRAHPLEARFLGVLGVHHWGLALREVNRARDGSINPFPRLALLKSLVAQVAMDLST